MRKHTSIERLSRLAIWPKIVKTPNTIGQFCKEDDGATAVEFGMLALPFFLLFMSIIECSLFFFSGQMMESAIDTVGREIRVGILNQTTTADQFKAAVCEEAKILFDCSKIKVDLKVVDTFNNLGGMPQPVDGVVVDEAYGFATPGAERIIMITASYEWPIYTNYLQKYMSGLNSGNALITAVSVFKSEPY